MRSVGPILLGGPTLPEQQLRLFLGVRLEPQPRDERLARLVGQRGIRIVCFRFFRHASPTSAPTGPPSSPPVAVRVTVGRLVSISTIVSEARCRCCRARRAARFWASISPLCAFRDARAAFREARAALASRRCSAINVRLLWRSAARALREERRIDRANPTTAKPMTPSRSATTTSQTAVIRAPVTSDTPCGV